MKCLVPVVHLGQVPGPIGSRVYAARVAARPWVKMGAGQVGWRFRNVL